MCNTKQKIIGKITRNVDIVFVIDSTSDMGNTINSLKKGICYFYEQLIELSEKRGKSIDKLRVKIISFRDYLVDDVPMLVTDFYNLPDDTDKVINILDTIIAAGGGDEPENGLEALAYAIKSKWDTSCMKSRHIIVLYTDAPAHELGYAKSASLYPTDMAKDFNELSEWWDNPDYIKQSAKRLVMFAPDTPEWNDISNNWYNVIHTKSKVGEGISENSINETAKIIVNFCI